MARRERTHTDRVRLRMTAVFAVFLALLLLLAGRAFHLQYLQGARYRDLADDRQVSRTQLTHRRGPIYDRAGQELAVSMDADSVYAEPPKVTDPAATAKALARSLSLRETDVRAKLASTKHFAWIKRLAGDEEARALRGLGLPGVGFIPESRRYYPLGGLAAQLLGFVGLDCLGLEGIERRFDTELRGTPGYLLGERDARGGVFFPAGVQYRDSVPGGSLTLTLDARIQFFAEEALDEAMAKTSARGAVALVMDPHTGEILAMASRPTFDPNRGGRASADARRNRAVTDAYEPGSTFKAFLMAAALEEGLPRPADAKVDCGNGSWRYGGATLHDTHPHGMLTLPEIVKVSSNIGAGKIAVQMGKETFYRRIRSFGFGETTGSDLVGEAGGISLPPSRWSKVGLVTQAFGQGIAVTPIQMLTAFNALVNGGLLMKPYLVRQLTGPGQEVLDAGESRIVRRVLSRANARRAAEILTLVTQAGGTGTQAAIPGFQVAGKTGTAEKVVPATQPGQRSYYDPVARVASFVGAVPAERPILSLLVVIDDPKGPENARYGGVCAAPVWRQIAVKSLAHLGVFADEPSKIAALARPLPVSEEPGPADPAPPIGPAPDYSSPSVMPDLAGLSMRTVMRIAQERALAITVVGTGRAVAQNPAAGTTLTDPRRVRVVFAPPS
jgi:cell division protein FtsI (penicillin-binding protein 3)